jgi:ribosome-associated protein
VTEPRIRVTSSVSLVPRDLVWRVSRSGGPGGQHANTSDTRVEVSVDVRHCSGLTGPQRSLLISRLGPVVRAVAADTRSQARNRELAQVRLVGRLAAALRTDPTRISTRPSRSARRQRVESKRHRSQVKRMRGRPDRDD